MRKAVMLVGILMLSSIPVSADEPTTIHLWSEQAPGPVLLWQNGGDMISVDSNQPIDIDIPAGTYFFVRLIDGIPQMNRLVFSENTNATDFLQENLTHWSSMAGQMVPGPVVIEGNSHLDIEGAIARSETMNASWTSSIRLPASLGHPGLEGAVRGISEQMSMNGFEDENAFSAWVINNTEIGCCAYDRSEMTASNISISVFFDGPVWGWDINAELVGQGDGRSTRLLWVPITGSVEDHTDLRITLPEPHEIRYSPQSEYISGLPYDFVIHRSDIPVTGNATIALGTNVAPVVAFHANNGQLPWLPYSQLSEIVSDCTDSSITEPTNRFILREGNTTLLDWSQSSTLIIDAMFLNLSVGTWLNLTLECTDSQGLMGNESMDIYIDGVQPTRSLQMQYLHPNDANPVDVNYGNQSISIPSGAVLSGAVQAGDDSAPPVNIEWISNKSSGWMHLGIGNHAWNDIFVQGPHVNGQHLSIEDRHQEKSLTVYSLQLNISDAAGNVLTQNWDVTVTDRTSPTPRPALSIDGNYYGDLNHPIEGGSPIDVSMNESWDDIDAINQLTWTVELNGETLNLTTWNEIQSFVLPELMAGRHTLIVNATDLSGNTGTHSMMFVVEPPIGAMYQITEVVKVGNGGPGEQGALDVTIANDGQGESYFRLCYLSDCTAQFRAVEANVDGPGEMTHRIPVTEWATGEINIRIEYPDNTTSEYQTGLNIDSEMTPLMWILLAIPPLAGLVALRYLKQQPEEEES
jgi:hypothetical protein